MEKLIDTIFYYANTLDEYTDAIINHKILSRTIVFVEETGEIYKNGKVFGGYRKLMPIIEQLNEDMLNAMDESERLLTDLINELTGQVLDSFTSEIALITNKVDEYKNRLDLLRAEFEQGEVNVGDVKRRVDALNGVIEEIASWKSSATQTLTTFRSLIDAQRAQIIRQGELLNAHEGKITNFNEFIDLLAQTFQQYIENYDITNKVRNILGREMSLNNGLLHDFATKTDVDGLVRNSVDTWFNSLNPSWTQLTSRIEQVNGNVTTTLAGYDSRIQNMEAITTQFASWTDGDWTSLSSMITAASNGEAYFDIMAKLELEELSDTAARKLAARIFGYVNNTTGLSMITIQADHIRLLGTTWAELINAEQLIADAVLATALSANLLDITNGADNIKVDSNGIIHTNGNRHGFQLNIDGSGTLANGKISWNTNGNINIGGTATSTKYVTINNVTISDYWSKTELSSEVVLTINRIKGNNSSWDPQASTLVNWILGQIADAQLDGSLTSAIELAVDTYLDAQIEDANGPFRDFITGETLTGLGYATKDNLVTELNAKLYDNNGDLINPNGTIPFLKAMTGLSRLSQVLFDNQGNFVGLTTSSSLSSLVENALSGNTAYSNLVSWASDIRNIQSSGFSLKALINKLVGDGSGNVTSNLIAAEIIGEVNSSGNSVIKLSADKINLDGLTIMLHITGSRIDHDTYYQDISISPEGIGIHEKYEDHPLSKYYGLYLYAKNIRLQKVWANETTSTSISYDGIETPLIKADYIKYDENGTTKYELSKRGDLTLSGNLQVDIIVCDDFIDCDSLGANIVGANSIAIYDPDPNSNNPAELSYNSTTDRLESNKGISIEGNIYASGNITTGNNGFVFTQNVESAGDLSLTSHNDMTLYASNSITSNKTISTTSDIRLKDVIELAEASIESIAETPIFYYKWKNIETDSMYLGTSAQYIQTIFPYAVKVLKDDTLTLDYASTALASAVTAAREIVALKARVAELEAKLNNL